MINIPAIGYLLSGIFFSVLFVLLLINWKKKLQGGFLLTACGASALWSYLITYQLFFQSLPSYFIWLAESLRDISWILFLAYVLWDLLGRNQISRLWLGLLVSVSILVSFILATPFEAWLISFDAISSDNLVNLRFSGYLILSIIGISLIEQLFRNTSTESRWAIKYLCLGLGLGFAYDFYLYADALLFQRLDFVVWESRGTLNSLIAPLVAVSAKRNTDWSLTVFVSKKVVFHTTGIIGAGFYLIIMSLIGYYIRDHGGEYGDFFRLVFLGAAVVLLFIMVSSGQLRAKLKVFLNKNFFKYQYDYRDEWLNLIRVLSETDTPEPLAERVLSVMTGVVDSQKGCLWICQGKNNKCHLAANKNFNITDEHTEIDWSGLKDYLQETHWVIDRQEYLYNRQVYGDLVFSDALLNDQDLWLIVPLFFNNQLFGVVWVGESNSIQKLNWENRDLLMMAGLQSASYLALERAATELSEAKQFEGFNRLSAFVIHDLKNLIAQLSLVASNAARHKHNPEFIDDAITTIENSVGKMNRLMLQLKSAGSTEKTKLINIVHVVKEVIKEKSRQTPVPQLRNELNDDVLLKMEPERLGAVIGHVVQNAQDATPPEGKTTVAILPDDNSVRLDVIDNGSGMDEDFIKNRLFKPFDTTKGLTGMGIGAFECKEFIESMNGSVSVSSSPGQGTTFSIKIPLPSEVE